MCRSTRLRPMKPVRPVIAILMRSTDCHKEQTPRLFASTISYSGATPPSRSGLRSEPRPWGGGWHGYFLTGPNGGVCLRLGLPGRPRMVRQEPRPPRLLPFRIEGFLPMPGEARGLLRRPFFQKLAHLRLALQRLVQQTARSHRIVDLAQPILQLLQRLETLFHLSHRIARTKKLQR